MESSVIRLVELLGDARQYLVPLFQRPYSWGDKNWERLWDDIIDLCEAQNPRPHFFGAVVLIPARSVPEGVTKYSLIDGQQRYTTISILFAALRQVALQRGETRLAEEIYERFLTNKFAEGNDRFKLLPTQGDREPYKNIILGQLSSNDDSLLAEAYRYFESKIRRADIDLKKIKDVVERYLSVVRILLDEREDPHAVFESLNAKGLSLSQVDLIRNYFLMKIHTNKQEEIYSKFWRPMEETLGAKGKTRGAKEKTRGAKEKTRGAKEKTRGAKEETLGEKEETLGEKEKTRGAKEKTRGEKEKTRGAKEKTRGAKEKTLDILAEFMRHYLIMRRGNLVKEADVYYGLRDYVEPKDAVEELKTLSHFSTYYAKILELVSESDQAIARAIHRLNRLKVTTAYPFLLACYDDYNHKTLSREEFLEVLKVLENFIVRCFVCNVHTKNFNKIFASLYQEAKESQRSFVESVKDILEKRGYPKDYEFERALREAKLYGDRDRKEKTKFILETLEESYGHKEQVNLAELQIEHVMPQKLTDWWKKHLGENFEFIRETLLHTLGNLTLTGYNSELSNSDFGKKKSRYRDSHLELNTYFSEIETWREADIQLRAQELAKRCLNIWSYFGKNNIVQQPEVQPEQKYTFETMHNGDYLRGKVRKFFDAFQHDVLKLGEVREEILKQCIVYRVGNNTFVSVVPLRSSLKLYLNVPFNEVRHEGSFCRDVSNKGHWGTGDVEVKVRNLSDVGRVMPLVERAYRKAIGLKGYARL